MIPTQSPDPRRPAVLLFYREHPAAAALLDDGAEPYEWGQRAAQLDTAAGLAPMTDEQHAELWHRDYAEGYRDAIADHYEHTCCCNLNPGECPIHEWDDEGETGD